MAALVESVRLEHFSLAGLPLPVTLRLEQPISDAEIIAFSYRIRPYRVERNAEGELEIMSPSGIDGSWRELFAGRMLGNWADEHGGLCVGASAGFRLSDTSVRSPDAAWISDEWASRLTAEQKRKFAPFCPEFLIEVLSETDSRRTLERKMDMWMSAGAQLAWMIDPYAADITIYRAGLGLERLLRPDWVEADAIVTGFRLQTSKMWDN